MQGLDLSKVTLLAKIIATEKDEVTSAIIRGTNSQNVVYNEAFETTRDFHKNLEEFFTVMVRLIEFIMSDVLDNMLETTKFPPLELLA